MSAQAVGLVAGTLTTAAWIPQLTRTWRTRSAEGLSWTYLLTFAGGVSTWLVYGALSADLPVLAANSVSAALILALVRVKAVDRRRTGRRTPRPPAAEHPNLDVRHGSVVRGRCERSTLASQNRSGAARCTRPGGPDATERNRH